MNKALQATPFSRTSPYIARVKSRWNLTSPESTKLTQHMVLDLSGSGITYSVGDSLGVCPRNSVSEVAATLRVMGFSGDEVVIDHRVEESLSLRDFLSFRANLSTVSRKLASLVLGSLSDGVEKEQLLYMLEQASRPDLKAYLEKHHVWDFMRDHGASGIGAQDLVDVLSRLLPRFYSIASSQSAVGDEVHLTVAHLSYSSNALDRHGVATEFLCHGTPLDTPSVAIYVQETKDFRLPEEEDRDIIMIGPGTGIAPFRAFVQERQHQGSSGRQWLFFGERTCRHEFYYEDEWNAYVEQGVLQLTTAFSRDQDHKIYVQDRMLEHGKELWSWLQGGASIYVCGDASSMAKSVDQAIHQVAEDHGGLNAEAAKDFVKQLRKDKRYLRDVY